MSLLSVTPSASVKRVLALHESDSWALIGLDQKKSDAEPIPGTKVLLYNSFSLGSALSDKSKPLPVTLDKLQGQACFM